MTSKSTTRSMAIVPSDNDDAAQHAEHGMNHRLARDVRQPASRLLIGDPYPGRPVRKRPRSARADDDEDSGRRDQTVAAVVCRRDRRRRLVRRMAYIVTPVAARTSGVRPSVVHSTRVMVPPKSPACSGKIQSSHAWSKTLPSSGVPS